MCHGHAPRRPLAGRGDGGDPVPPHRPGLVVAFRNFGQTVYATKLRLKVDVQPVPGEANRSKQPATYPVCSRRASCA